MIAATEGAAMFVVLALLLAEGEGGRRPRRRQGCYRSRYSGTRRAGALLVGDVGCVAMTAAAEVAVMLVVLMLPLRRKHQLIQRRGCYCSWRSGARRAGTRLIRGIGLVWR